MAKKTVNSQETETVEVGTYTQKVAEPKEETTTVATQTQKFQPSEDAMQNKNIAWLAYLLFFIPLCINSKSAFVRHHANEGLEINIIDVIGLTLLIVGAVVNSANEAVHTLMLIFVLVGIGLLVLTLVTKIYMIVSSLKGKEVSTPWMWDLRIIK